MEQGHHNNKNHAELSHKVLLVLISILFGFAVIHLFLQYINLHVFDEQNIILFELTNRFDFSDEMSIPTWYAQFLFLLTSVLAVSIAFLERTKKTFYYWLFLSGVLLLGSINEVASIHESVLQIIHLEQFGESASTYRENAWIVALPFILVMGVTSLYIVYRNLPSSVTKSILIATTVYFTGAIGVDIFDGVISERTFFEQGPLAVLEEGLELLGISIFIYGLVRYLEDHYQNNILSALAALRQM